jgi:hypothetical protein
LLKDTEKSYTRSFNCLYPSPGVASLCIYVLKTALSPFTWAQNAALYSPNFDSVRVRGMELHAECKDKIEIEKCREKRKFQDQLAHTDN